MNEMEEQLDALTGARRATGLMALGVVATPGYLDRVVQRLRAADLTPGRLPEVFQVIRARAAGLMPGVEVCGRAQAVADAHVMMLRERMVQQDEDLAEDDPVEVAAPRA